MYPYGVSTVSCFNLRKMSLNNLSNASKQYLLGIDASSQIQRISLTGFPAQSVGSSNTDVLDSPCLLVLITGTSQSRQHGKSESDSYYLSDLVVNSFTGPTLISSYHKLDSYRILQVTYQELV
ncbi:hypothetical protein Tco_1371314 [Tanacetum coccineum]